MALTSTIEYCTDRDIFDVYPQIKSADSKTRIYGWVVHSSNLYRADNAGLTTQLFANGQDLGSAQANSGVVNDNDEWFYESTLDAVYYYNSSTSPNDMVMEAGEDAATFTQRYRRNASRYVESKLDSRMASEISLDREGLYPYIIKRTTALVAVAMMIKAEDPMDDVGNAFMEEANEYLNGLRTGEIQLPTSVTGDSPYGVIRDVSYTSGKIRPIQTRGSYSGTYDLIKIKIIDSGAIGTATYSVWEKSSTDLKSTNIVSAETINGDYQQCAGGLEVRFAGATDATTANANDEWEIEVYGVGEDVRTSNVGNINMTRGAYHVGKMRYKGGYKRVGHRKMKY
jgi:hypothetical protein|tara:strand:- start:7 stop:1029 length:1023 start_codon:yes stop_codon:yes gene_type:complete